MCILYFIVLVKKCMGSVYIKLIGAHLYRFWNNMVFSRGIQHILQSRDKYSCIAKFSEFIDRIFYYQNIRPKIIMSE